MHAHQGTCPSTHVCICICAKTCIHKCKIHTQEKWKKKTSKALYPEAWADSSPRSLKVSSLRWNCSSADAVIMTSQSACNSVTRFWTPKGSQGWSHMFLKKPSLWSHCGTAVEMNPGQQEWASQLITGTMGRRDIGSPCSHITPRYTVFLWMEWDLSFSSHQQNKAKVHEEVYILKGSNMKAQSQRENTSSLCPDAMKERTECG